MHPLPAHTVQLVLQYISPLSDPLPPHLVSTPLRQRHHLLQLSPSSPAEYLCWPSPDNTQIIDLLDRSPLLSDRASFPTRYTSDSECTFAHVQISFNAQGLRMLFHWDDSHGWKYHDLRLMPFPSESYSTPQQSHAACEAPPSSSLEAGRINGSDHDPYWDAYGASEHTLTSPSSPQSSTSAVEGEDAYWAQYAAVQGSADSTVPSPLPIHRKLRPVNGGSPFSSSSENVPIVDIPADAIHSRFLTSKLGPPSPNTLTHILTTVSPRKETYSPVLDDPELLQSPSAYSADPSPKQTAADSELVTPPLPNGHLDASVSSPMAFKLDGAPLFECPSRPQTEDIALTDSIKGLYHLWKAGRKGEQDEKDRSVFLRIVQAAIA